MHVKSTTLKSRGETAKRMAEDAVKFLGTLTRGQREKASFEVSSDERMNWHYIPRTPQGAFLQRNGWTSAEVRVRLDR